jgi:hypothetical protein
VTYLKGTVFFLLFANAVYFLWVHGIATPRAANLDTTPAASLKLVTEAPTEATVSGAPSTSGTPTPAEPAPAAPEPVREAAAPGLLNNVKRCITVGPFPDVAEAAHAAATLRSGGYQPRQRVTEGEVWAGVWVYLPLPATAPTADQVRAKLKAGGIDDALEMPGPNDKPVISLGLYSEPKRAQARVVQAQALGLNPGIADRKRTGDVYWVDVDLKPTDGLLNPADLQGETGRIVRLEVKACPVAENPSP